MLSLKASSFANCCMTQILVLAVTVDGTVMREARGESPALLEPIFGTRLVAWVGADERPEFVRQNALLANVWTGLGAETQAVVEENRHHFNVIEGLEDSGSAMVQTWLGE